MISKLVYKSAMRGITKKGWQLYEVSSWCFMSPMTYFKSHQISMNFWSIKIWHITFRHLRYIQNPWSIFFGLILGWFRIDVNDKKIWHLQIYRCHNFLWLWKSHKLMGATICVILFMTNQDPNLIFANLAQNVLIANEKCRQISASLHLVI